MSRGDDLNTVVRAVCNGNERRRAGHQLHAIADRIDAFRREFREDATKGTGIDELVEQAKALLLDAAHRTPLMGLPPDEQAKLAKALKLRVRLKPQR